MGKAVIISLLTCIALIVTVILKPSIEFKGKSISIYWAVPLVGALILTLTSCISATEIADGLTAKNEVNPIKILILFISMTLISVFLDSAGFFRLLATSVLNKTSSSQNALFCCLYFTVSILTVFTSNDIIVLTFTPFICYFARNAKIDPLPYLICEFVAANTWSMALIVGNPTNIYFAASAGATFINYCFTMALPTVLCGFTSFLILWLLFRKKLKQPMSMEEHKPVTYDKTAVIIGLIHLMICIVMLGVSSYLNIEMWKISLSCMASMLVVTAIYLIYKHKPFGLIFNSFRRVPMEIIPFVLSMFVIVLALQKCGVTNRIANFLNRGSTVFNFGISSFLTANVINNIPMSVLFSSVTAKLSSANYTKALYASIIGSNIGAFFTPIGALAGIMWTGMLKNHGVRLRFRRFMGYGTVIAVPSLLAALVGLLFVL